MPNIWASALLCLAMAYTAHCKPQPGGSPAVKVIKVKCFKGWCDPRTEFCVKSTEQCHACSHLCGSALARRRIGHQLTECERECPVYLETKFKELQSRLENCTVHSSNETIGDRTYKPARWWILAFTLIIVVLLPGNGYACYKICYRCHDKDRRTEASGQIFALVPQGAKAVPPPYSPSPTSAVCDEKIRCTELLANEEQTYEELDAISENLAGNSLASRPSSLPDLESLLDSSSRRSSEVYGDRNEDNSEAESELQSKRKFIEQVFQ